MKESVIFYTIVHGNGNPNTPKNYREYSFCDINYERRPGYYKYGYLNVFYS